MVEKSQDTINKIILITSIITIFVPVIIFLFASPEKITPTTIIIFATIGIFLLIYSIYTHINSKWQGISQSIIKHNSDIEKIKKSINSDKLYRDMNTRLSIVETLLKNKRGQSIDPRILLWILLAILLYLFLKSFGILP